MPCCATPDAIVGNPGGDDPVWIDNDYAFVCLDKKKFYAGCPSCRKPLHLSGLGTGFKKHKNMPPMAGLVLAYSLHLKNNKTQTNK